MALPNTGMDAVPFTPLTAEFLDDMIENIESLSSGTGLQDAAVTASKVASNAVTSAKIADAAVTASKVDYSTIPKAKVVMASDTSIPNNTWTSIAFGAEVFDVGNMHDNSTNNSRITVPAGQSGVYVATGMIRFQSNNAGGRGGRFLINGVNTNYNSSGGWFGNAQQGLETHINISSTMNLSAGDYVEFQCFQTSGGALNVQLQSGERSFSTSFSLARIA